MEAADGRDHALPQWNIERGYQLAAVVAALKAIDADVVALQEVDIGCDRSGNEDTGARRLSAVRHLRRAVCQRLVMTVRLGRLRHDIGQDRETCAGSQECQEC